MKGGGEGRREGGEEVTGGWEERKKGERRGRGGEGRREGGEEGKGRGRGGEGRREGRREDETGGKRTSKGGDSKHNIIPV